jgi:SAM-dependent methyltransferase
MPEDIAPHSIPDVPGVNQRPWGMQVAGQENGGDGGSSSVLRSAHPWTDAQMAELYDVFPFSADLPFYLGLAEGRDGILELACGSGRVLLPLAEAGHRIVGLDASRDMLARAEEKLTRIRPEAARRVRLVQADMRSYALGELFDLAIIAVKSLVYVTDRADQERVLSCVAAHLRPGGLLSLDLLHPSPAWLAESPGSLKQDLVQRVPERGVTVARTEAVVSTDLAAQVRVIRSMYEVVADDGSVSKRFVEWPFRYTFRFEAEHLLERAGFEVQAVYGGYECEPFTSDARTMLLLARRR